MIIISEHQHCEERGEPTPLEVAMRDALWPLESFYQTLNDIDDGPCDLALVLEALLHHAITIQHDLIEYLEKKVGKIDISMRKAFVQNKHHCTGIWEESTSCHVISRENCPCSLYQCPRLGGGAAFWIDSNENEIIVAVISTWMCVL